jgi:hypothetical protein
MSTKNQRRRVSPGDIECVINSKTKLCIHKHVEDHIDRLNKRNKLIKTRLKIKIKNMFVIQIAVKQFFYVNYILHKT